MCSGRTCAVFSIITALVLAVVLRFLLTRTDVQLEIPKTGYFGVGDPKPDDPSIKKFEVNFSDNAIAELKQRLKSARIGHQELEDVKDWSYGARLSILNEWGKYWATEFDFAKAQARLNQFQQFLTQIEGIEVHFLHMKPSRPNLYKRVIPLLMSHGWPGNVFEFHKIIPILVDPKSHSLDSDVAFEVIAPSIPGYGFSEQPSKRGFDSVATARIFNRLMTERLGFKSYLAQGGDWGSLITSHLARLYPDKVEAIHLNMVWVSPFESFRHFLLSAIGSCFPKLVFSEPERYQNFSSIAQFWLILQESGYFHIQATKPDTVGVALNDSPFGLLAYILEKFSTWTNPSFRALPDGGLLKKFTRDELLTLISVYWLQGNILSSQRYYKENLSGLTKSSKLAEKYVTVPTAYAAFPYDLGGVTPRELLQLNFNVTYMTVFEDGGHFAAFEEPKKLAGDILKFANGSFF